MSVYVMRHSQTTRTSPFPISLPNSCYLGETIVIEMNLEEGVYHTVGFWVS